MTVASAIEGGTLTPEAAALHAREVVTKSGTSFGLGMKILPKARREAMFAIYAFCREIDDIADEGGTHAEKIAGLNGWRDEIERLYAGAPTYPTARALAGPIEQFDLPKEEFILLIEGMEMDANGPVVAPSWEELFAYCRRVAGAVGLLSMRAFGAPNNQTADRFALSLADALQTTNILRDVREDAEMGRLYLPRPLLEKYEIPTDDPKAAAAHPRLGELAREMSEVPKQRFTATRESLKSLDWKVLRPALLMMGVYETYLKRLEERGWEHVGPPVNLSKLTKLAIALRWAVAPPI